MTALPRNPRRNRLTLKQAAFIDNYETNGHNGAEAYRRAYNSKASPQVCSVEASRLLKHPKIALRIKRVNDAIDKRAAKTLEGIIISKETIAAELAKIAYYDIPDDDPVRPTDKRQALMDLAKLRGDIVEKRDVTLHTEYDSISDEELRDLIARRTRAHNALATTPVRLTGKRRNG